MKLRKITYLKIDIMYTGYMDQYLKDEFTLEIYIQHIPLTIYKYI